MISQADIQSAVVKHWLDNVNLPTAYPNQPYNPTSGQPWARMSFAMAPPTDTEIGARLTQQFGGVVDIELYYPSDTGRGDANDMADHVAAMFPRAKKLAYNSTVVSIERCYLTSAANTDGWFRVLLTVDFFSFQCQQ